MTKHRINYPITNTIKRMFRAFEENGEILSTNKVYSLMHEQVSPRTGRLYSKNPSKGTVAQILNKYPYFTKSGYIDETDVRGHRMRICTWKINEVRINESTSDN